MELVHAERVTSPKVIFNNGEYNQFSVMDGKRRRKWKAIFRIKIPAQLRRIEDHRSDNLSS